MHTESVFDIFKIGIGPSSSHTLGPWRAALLFVTALQNLKIQVAGVTVDLYGSLALTGKGHGTDIAIVLGLHGFQPESIPLEAVSQVPEQVVQSQQLALPGHGNIPFYWLEHIHFHLQERLPFHANGMRLNAFDENGQIILQKTYYSTGGGFIVEEGATSTDGLAAHALPFPAVTAADIIRFCKESGLPISGLMRANELALREGPVNSAGLLRIWQVMKESIYKGCHTGGILPGGLDVKRRAAELNRKLLGGDPVARELDAWMGQIMQLQPDFTQTNKWISCFAMAVNEENAGFGRIVTAPTNGAAGVIPAVLMYFICFIRRKEEAADIQRFLLVASLIGSMFKNRATISAAMGGCQAEIGVSSAMAAAALTELLDGTPLQCLMAAEIAMEHHLGLTCDPIGGLVQVPCIERNTMGAIKAITAAHLALESEPEKAKVSLDDVIDTMWETAQDMHTKYKETSLGGLATKVRLTLPEC